MTIGEPKVETRSEQPYVGIRTQVPMKGMGASITKTLKEARKWLQQHDITPTGAPFVRFHVINMEGLMDIEMCWPVAQAVPGDDRVKAGALPAGRYAALIYAGSGIKGNRALLEWGAKQGLKWDRWDVEAGDAFASRYETYMTDPAVEPKRKLWKTEVAIKVKDDRS